jgi:PhnB protein
MSSVSHKLEKETMKASSTKNVIAPILSVRKGPQAVEFYQLAFGAKVLFRLDNEETVVARLELEGAEFWVADESPEPQNLSPETLAAERCGW